MLRVMDRTYTFKVTVKSPRFATMGAVTKTGCDEAMEWIKDAINKKIESEKPDFTNNLGITTADVFFEKFEWT